MKAISLIKLLTPVFFLVISSKTIAADENETKDQCRIRINKEKSSEAEKTCSERKVTTTKSDGTRSEQPLNSTELRDCKKAELEALVSAECSEKESKKDRDAKCDTKAKEYDEAVKKAEEECGKLGSEDVKDCKEKAASCHTATDTSGDSAVSSDSAADAIIRILGMGGQVAGGGNAPEVAGCALEDDTVEKEKERIEDKVTKLKEEIADLKTKATEADKDLDEKRQKVEEDIIEVEKEFEKAKTERQTKNQEAAGRIQTAILNAEKKRRDNAAKIATLQTKIANFSFGNMEINLAFADSKIQLECRNKAIALRDAKTKPTVDPKTGKSVQPKFTLKESQAFKQQLKIEESNCLQQKALEKQKVIKGLMDNKRELQAQVKALEDSSADEIKAIENEKKQAEALKKISDEEEIKQQEAKFKKLDALNKSVVDMEKHVADKKRSFGEKAQAKEQQIQELLMKRAKVKPRFTKVTSSVKSSVRSAESFIGSCCPGGVSDHARCSSIKSDNPDVKSKKTGRSSSTR